MNNSKIMEIRNGEGNMELREVRKKVKQKIFAPVSH